MTEYRTFTKLMSEAISGDVLPDIAFTDNTLQLLGTSVEHLSTSTSPVTDLNNTPKNIATAIKEYQYSTSNMLANTAELEAFKSVADSFAKKLNVGIKSLSNIKRLVNEMTEEVLKKSNEAMSEDAAIAATMDVVSEPNIKFDKVNWEKLDVVNSVGHYRLVNNSISIPEDVVPSTLKIGILINRLPYGAPGKEVEFQDIKINKEAARATLDAVSKQVGKTLPIKDVKYVLSMLFSLDDYKCRKAVSLMNEMLENPEKINSLLQMVHDFSLVLRHVGKSTLKFSAPTTDELLHRKNVIQQYVDMATYISTYYRLDVWKDSVIVPGKKLNPDAWFNFRRKSGTSVGIAQHLTHFYPEDNLPRPGVNYNEVLVNRQKVLAAAKEYVHNHIFEVTERKKKIMRDTFTYVAGMWLTKNEKKMDRHI